VVAMKNMIIKVVTPCDLAEARQHFWGMQHFHLHACSLPVSGLAYSLTLHGVTAQIIIPFTSLVSES
jgi:hypothetical protein